MKSKLGLALLTTFTLFGCQGDVEETTGPVGQAAFARYVAIGTSISMGVQSDGVLYTTQQHSWPSLLADQALTTFSLPLIQAPGCFSPFVAPLQFGTRLSTAAAPGILPADTVCALFSNVTLPTNNVAIDGADTYDALRTTPESTVTQTQKRRRQYRIVLPPGKTQVTAMLQQNPTLVSVELGANEVLGAAITGLLVPATQYRPSNTYTYVPNAVWQPEYQRVIDSVAKTNAKVILAGVPNVSSLVSMRTGNELYADRTSFTSFGVVISSDCNGSSNLIFTPLKVLTAIATARATGSAATLSCADVPGTQDFVLTPANVATLTAVVNGMNSFIQSTATSKGWAYVDADAILATFVQRRPTYSVTNQLGCSLPYGQYVSLDGVHPNSYGHVELANAAATALNAKYGFEIPTVQQAIFTPAQLCP